PYRRRRWLRRLPKDRQRVREELRGVRAARRGDIDPGRGREIGSVGLLLAGAVRVTLPLSPVKATPDIAAIGSPSCSAKIAACTHLTGCCVRPASSWNGNFAPVRAAGPRTCSNHFLP